MLFAWIYVWNVYNWLRLNTFYLEIFLTVSLSPSIPVPHYKVLSRGLNVVCDSFHWEWLFSLLYNVQLQNRVVFFSKYFLVVFSPRTLQSVTAEKTKEKKLLDECKRNVWRNPNGKASKRYININIYVTCTALWFVKHLFLSNQKDIIVANLVAVETYSWDFSFRTMRDSVFLLSFTQNQR